MNIEAVLNSKVDLTYNSLSEEEKELFKSTFATGGRFPANLRNLIHQYWLFIPEAPAEEEGDPIVDAVNSLLGPKIRINPAPTSDGRRVICLDIFSVSEHHDALVDILGDMIIGKIGSSFAFPVQDDEGNVVEPDPVDQLAEAKKYSHLKIKNQRESLLANGFEFNGKKFQTRNDSDRINIMGVGVAAQAALGAGQPFSVHFRATDNSIVNMDGITAVRFYATMVGTAQVIWDKYNTAYEAINAATTVEEANAVTMIEPPVEPNV